MKVLYSHYLTQSDHPAAQMVHAIASGLRQAGHEVLVHGSDGPWAALPRSRATDAAPRRRGLLSRMKTRLWFLRGLAQNSASSEGDLQAIRSFRPDVVLCRNDPYRFSMHSAARREGVPLVSYADAPAAYECRGFASDRWHPPRILEAVEKWCLRRSAAAITISGPAKQILDAYGLDTPVYAVPNGVDLHRFPHANPEKNAELRARFRIATPLVAGFLGTFQRFHGVGLLAELIEATADRTDLTWLLVGDGPERERLQAAALKNPRVVFAGRQPAHFAAQLVGLMDVMVAPHARRLEHFYFCPLKILEAMAAGAVCLASDQGDIPQLLENGDAGRLVRTDNPQDWLRGLSILLEDPALRKRLARCARRNVEVNYTWKQTALSVLEVLEKAAGRPNSRESSWHYQTGPGNKVLCAT